MIQALGKPWYRRRALRVFRDDTSFRRRRACGRRSSRRSAIRASSILLASPEAAASPWVNKEVSYWLDNKGADTLLIALTDGELVVGQCGRRFRLAREHAAAAGADRPLRHRAEMGRSARLSRRRRSARQPLHRGGRRFRRRHPRHAEGGFAFAGGAPAAARACGSPGARRPRCSCFAGSPAGRRKSRSTTSARAIEQRNIAEQQRRLAQEQRDRAERSLAAATQTANSLVFDLAQELRDRARHAGRSGAPDSRPRTGTATTTGRVWREQRLTLRRSEARRRSRMLSIPSWLWRY